MVREIINTKKLVLLIVMLLVGAIFSVHTTNAIQFQQDTGVVVEKSISEDVIAVGDRLNVTVSIRNENPVPIGNVELIDTAPDAFWVVSGSLVEFWTAINEFESINHTYTLEARTPGNYTLEAAEVSYELTGESFTARSNTLKIQIEPKLWTPPQGSIENPSVLFMGVYILPVIGLLVGAVVIARKKR
jgi:uncharacterized repeat protein (TIGR01451 family)